MATWAYVLHLNRAGAATDASQAEKDTVTRHWHHVVEAGNQGHVRFFGRSQNADERKFGIVVFEAEDEPAARAFMESDPAVQAGVMTAELFPFRIAFLHGRDD